MLAHFLRFPQQTFSRAFLVRSERNGWFIQATLKVIEHTFQSDVPKYECLYTQGALASQAPGVSVLLTRQLCCCFAVAFAGHKVINSMLRGGEMFNRFPYLSVAANEPVKWYARHAIRALVPSMLVCPRAVMPKSPVCPLAIDVVVVSCSNFRNAHLFWCTQVLKCEILRRVLMEASLAVALESLH